MTKSVILEKVQDIFRDVLDNDEIVLTAETTADDVDEWDSLTHVQLTVAIEKEFGIKFTAKEILGWESISDCVENINTKLLQK